MQSKGFLLLNDLGTTGNEVWTSVREMELRLCRSMRDLGFVPILGVSEITEEMASRYRSVGALIAYLSHAGGEACFRKGIRNLLQRHNVTLLHLDHFPYHTPIPWFARLRGVRNIVYVKSNSGSLRAKGWRKRLVQLRARIVTKPIVKVIAVSEFIKSRLIECGIPPAKIVVVYNGIDTERFCPDTGARARWASQFAIEAGEIILAHVAFLHRFKHPEVIVEACGLLKRRGLAVRLFMAGDGEMRHTLEERSTQLGIADRVHFLGNYNGVESLLKASDIFVLGSVGEAFGCVLTEAMACGIPVVASRSGGISEVVEDGTSGLLATPLNPTSFADSIERLARDSELRRGVGLNGRERVKQQFDIDRMVRETITVYESIWNHFM